MNSTTFVFKFNRQYCYIISFDETTNRNSKNVNNYINMTKEWIFVNIDKNLKQYSLNRTNKRVDMCMIQFKNYL